MTLLERIQAGWEIRSAVRYEDLTYQEQLVATGLCKRGLVYMIRHDGPGFTLVAPL